MSQVFFFLINLHPLAPYVDKVKPEKMLMFHEALRSQTLKCLLTAAWFKAKRLTIFGNWISKGKRDMRRKSFRIDYG